MPFALDSNPSASEISEAINYILANFGGGATVDPVTGQVIAPGGTFIGYIYQYIAVKYADSADGSVNFSNSPTNRSYFGLRNSNDASESTNPADYIWYQASGGFGSTKSLWYITTGGRQIQFAVSITAPDSGWVVDPGSSIDLDIVTSNTAPVIAEAFVTFFAPPTLQVPRSGNPLTPSFTGITPRLYATDQGAIIPFVDAQTDTAVNFTNNTWRIGNSSTTGNGDISYTNITIGSPTDGGDYAEWPVPTAMSNSPAYITVPIRFKNGSGIVSQASVAICQLIFADPGATGGAGSSIDISGYTSFVQNAGGLFTPSSAALSALIQNITSPTYSWTVSGATPTSGSSSTIVVTPTSMSTGVTVTLTVNGSNLLAAISKTIAMPIVYDGAAGTAGANGLMSAFPTIYIWTGSSSVPTRPASTSVYTWATGGYSAPAGWYTEPPSNTTPGNYLWAITIPLTVSATTTTSSLDWTNVTYPIRAIAFNGNNGTNGTNGANGTNGTNGSATFVVTRVANDSSAPTNVEVNAIVGRNPVSGDICTVSYNNANNAVVYQYITSWSLFQTYITGSLIVQNTITSDKMVANLMSSDNTLTRGLTVRDNSGNVLLAAGTPLNYSNIVPSSAWLNSNISMNSNGTLSGAGAGQVTLGGLGAGTFASLSLITSANVSTYIDGAAIGTAQVGILTATNIGANSIATNKIQVGAVSTVNSYAFTGSTTAIPSTGNFYTTAWTAMSSNFTAGGYPVNFFGSWEIDLYTFNQSYQAGNFGVTFRIYNVSTGSAIYNWYLYSTGVTTILEGSVSSATLIFPITVQTPTLTSGSTYRFEIQFVFGRLDSGGSYIPWNNSANGQYYNIFSNAVFFELKV